MSGPRLSRRPANALREAERLSVDGAANSPQGRRFVAAQYTKGGGTSPPPFDISEARKSVAPNALARVRPSLGAGRAGGHRSVDTGRLGNLMLADRSGGAAVYRGGRPVGVIGVVVVARGEGGAYGEKHCGSGESDPGHFGFPCSSGFVGAEGLGRMDPAADKTHGVRDLFPAHPFFQSPQQPRLGFRPEKDKRLQMLVITNPCDAISSRR
ncbi:hypothetical protein MPL1032_20537 [Mesorhizobium plurifarium]|uniref:Uncharacterized protein n=1 Tax=Mesorhizobium plurifarium TaxID=69974 RepID=A0A0K2VXX4_MESPL|nr:hypothetical protein MPL1032_20537 [Mesorhizobium plurifarium]